MKIEMLVDSLNTIFKACKNYVSKDEVIPVIKAIQLNCKGGICKAIALDRYKVMNVVVPYEGDEGVICIPIIKLPKQVFVTISDEGNDVIFDFFTEKQIVKKHDGDFPNTDKLIPKTEPALKIGFNPKLLRDALDGFAGENCVEIDFFDEKQMCIIKSSNKNAFVLPINLKR